MKFILIQKSKPRRSLCPTFFFPRKLFSNQGLGLALGHQLCPKRIRQQQCMSYLTEFRTVLNKSTGCKSMFKDSLIRRKKTVTNFCLNAFLGAANFLICFSKLSIEFTYFECGGPNLLLFYPDQSQRQIAFVKGMIFLDWENPLIHNTLHDLKFNYTQKNLL